jgi:hypothetical protein
MLGLFYVDHRSFIIDLQLCWLTGVAIVSRQRAIHGVVLLLRRLGAPTELLEIASRKAPLVPMAPPGSADVVTSRG